MPQEHLFKQTGFKSSLSVPPRNRAITLPTCRKPILLRVPHDEVVHVTHVASAVHDLLQVMIEDGQVVIGKELAGEVPDRYAPARRRRVAVDDAVQKGQQHGVLEPAAAADRFSTS